MSESDVDSTSVRCLVEPISHRARQAPATRIYTLVGEDGAHKPLSAADVDREARMYAAGLRRADIAPGDVVVLAIAPLRQLLCSFLGCLYRGALPTISSLATDRLDPALQRQRLMHLVGSSAARAVIATADRRDLFATALDGSSCRALACEDLRNVEDAADAEPFRSAPDDIAFLQFSSGTAGPQKAIPNRHGSVLRYLHTKRTWFGRPYDILASWLPLYHDFGLITGVLFPAVFGAHAVLMQPQHWVRDPKILFEIVHRYRATICFLPNFALNHCARAIRDRDLEGIDLGSLQDVAIGGEPVRVESLRMFAERFARYGLRAPLRTGYGMAETVEGVTAAEPKPMPTVDWIDRNSLQSEQRAVPAAAEQPGSVAFVSCGVPMLGAEVRIVDAEAQALPERRVGEIETRATYMFSGYYREPALSARVIRDGWFRTGDLGYLADGELYVTGRKSDLIIVGGRKVQPEDLEQVADEIPGLLPGRSVAFGCDDPLLGSERIVMVCETRPDCDAEQKAALERQLRRQVLQEIGVTLGDVRLVARGWTIKTSSGKTARRTNRDKFLRELRENARPNAATNRA